MALLNSDIMIVNNENEVLGTAASILASELNSGVNSIKPQHSGKVNTNSEPTKSKDTTDLLLEGIEQVRKLQLDTLEKQRALSELFTTLQDTSKNRDARAQTLLRNLSEKYSILLDKLDDTKTEFKKVDVSVETINNTVNKLEEVVEKKQILKLNTKTTTVLKEVFNSLANKAKVGNVIGSTEVKALQSIKEELKSDELKILIDKLKGLGEDLENNKSKAGIKPGSTAGILGSTSISKTPITRTQYNKELKQYNKERAVYNKNKSNVIKRSLGGMWNALARQVGQEDRVGFSFVKAEESVERDLNSKKLDLERKNLQIPTRKVNKHAQLPTRKVKKHAQGGIISKPSTIITEGGDVGVVGEAGPEVIVPLHKTTNNIKDLMVKNELVTYSDIKSKSTSQTVKGSNTVAAPQNQTVSDNTQQQPIVNNIVNNNVQKQSTRQVMANNPISNANSVIYSSGIQK